MVGDQGGTQGTSQDLCPFLYEMRGEGSNAGRRFFRFVETGMAWHRLLNFHSVGLERGWEFAFLVDGHVLPPLVWGLDF